MNKRREDNLSLINVDGIKKLPTSEYRKIKKSKFDFYVNVNSSDDLTKLAYKYYGDATLWWVLALANDLLFPYNINEDIILRIPPINSI
jgi:hypothetical protein